MKNNVVDDLMLGMGFNNFSEINPEVRKRYIKERFGYKADEPYNLDTEKLDLLMYQDAKDQITAFLKELIKVQKAKCETIEYKLLKGDK